MINPKKTSSIFFLVLMLASVATADDIKKKEPLNITGDSVEYFYEKNQAEAKGNVRVEYQDWILTADRVDANLKTKDAIAHGNVVIQNKEGWVLRADEAQAGLASNEASADGNIQINYKDLILTSDHVNTNLETKEAWAKNTVVLTQPGAIYEGDAVYVNFETGYSEASELHAKVEPFYRGKSKKIQRKEEGLSYVLEDAYLTTCEEGEDCQHGDPLYRLQAQSIVYYPDERLEMNHVVLYFGHLPLFYLPRMVIPIKDFDQFPIQTEVGKNGEWGAFALSKVRYYLNPDHDGNVLLDVRENQGFAWGVEHFYRDEKLGRGALRTYFADDQCAEDSEDCSRSKTHVASESSRYRIQERHQMHLGPSTALNFELNKLSDEFVIQDFFFREEFERITIPDNYVSIIHAKDDHTLSFLSRYRLDDFFGVVERLPEVRFDTHTKPLGKTGETPFYYRSVVEAAWLNKTFKDIDRSDANQDVGRVDVRNRISYVHKVGPWTATPYVGVRNTYYSRDHLGDDRNFIRNNVEAGVDVSAKFFKTYDIQMNQLGIQFEKIRHVFTPNISYFYQSTPTHVKDSLFDIDRIDLLDHESAITLDFENKLQIKYRDDENPDQLKKRNLLRSIISFEFDIPQGDESRLDNVAFEATFNPYEWLRTDMETVYSFEEDQFDNARLNIIAHNGPVKLGFEQSYFNGSSNQSTVHFEWQLDEEWKIGVYERFDFQRDSLDEGGRNNEFELTLEKRNFYCWTIALTYNRSHRENSFFVTFSPTTFEQTAFRRKQQFYEP